MMCFKTKCVQKKHPIFIFLIGDTYFFEHILGNILNRYWPSGISRSEITNPNNKS